MSWEILKWNGGTSLVVQWIRLWASTAEGMGSIPGQRTKIPHATQPKKKKRKIFNKINLNFESCPMIRCSWCIFSAEDPEKSGFIIVHNLVSAYLSVFLSDFSSHTRGRILEIFIFLLPFFQVAYFSWQFLPAHSPGKVLLTFQDHIHIISSRNLQKPPQENFCSLITLSQISNIYFPVNCLITVTGNPNLIREAERKCIDLKKPKGGLKNKTFAKFFLKSWPCYKI